MNGVGQGEEVVTVLLCEEWYKAMVEFGCVVNARIRGGGVNRFAGRKLCVVVVNKPGNDRGVNEKDEMS